MNSIQDAEGKIREGKFGEAVAILRSVKNRSKSQIKKKFIEKMLVEGKIIEDKAGSVAAENFFEQQIRILGITF